MMRRPTKIEGWIDDILGAAAHPVIFALAAFLVLSPAFAPLASAIAGSAIDSGGGGGSAKDPAPTAISAGVTAITAQQTNLRVTAGAGASITMPACSSAAATMQKIFKVKLLDANTVTIDFATNGGTGDGSGTFSWATQYEYHEFACSAAGVWDVR